MCRESENRENTLASLEHEFLLVDHEIRRMIHHDIVSSFGATSNALELIRMATQEPGILTLVDMAEASMQKTRAHILYNLDIHNLDVRRQYTLNVLKEEIKNMILHADTVLTVSFFEKYPSDRRSVKVNLAMLIQLIHLIIKGRTRSDLDTANIVLTCEDSGKNWRFSIKSRMTTGEMRLHELERENERSSFSNLERRWKEGNLIQAIAKRVPAEIVSSKVDATDASVTLVETVEIAVEK